LFTMDVIKLEDPNFTNTPWEIAMNPRYMSHFKVRQMFVKCERKLFSAC
jgi:phage anti-repressor protein